MGFLFRGRVRAAALVLVVVGFAGGIAYASIPDSSGVIHGCYKKASPKRGTLRVIDRKKGQKCSSAEYALDWNQTGRRGPTGPTGPSDVHTNYGASTLVQRADTATVASVTLPVGSYSLSANITVIAGSDPGQANCSFVSAGALRQNAAVAAVESYGTNAWAQTMSIVGDVTVTSNSTSVFLRCTPTGAALTFRGGLIATKVGTITPSV